MLLSSLIECHALQSFSHSRAALLSANCLQNNISSCYLALPSPTSFQVILQKVIPKVVAHTSGEGATLWRGVDVLIESDALAIIIEKYMAYPAHDELNPSISFLLKGAFSFCGVAAAEALVQNLSDTAVAIKMLQDQAREAVSPFVCNAFVDVIRSLKRTTATSEAMFAKAKPAAAKKEKAERASGKSSAYVKDSHVKMAIRNRITLQQKRVESLRARSEPLFTALKGENRTTVLSSSKSMVQIFQTRDAFNCLAGLKLTNLNNELKRAGKPVVGEHQEVSAAKDALVNLQASSTQSTEASNTFDLAKPIAEQALALLSKALAKPGDSDLQNLFDDIHSGNVSTEAALQRVSRTIEDSKKTLSALERDSSAASSAVRKKLEASTIECESLEKEIKALEAKLEG